MIVEMCDGISRCVDAHASSPRTSETGKSSGTRHALLRSRRHARLSYFRVVPQVGVSNVVAGASREGSGRAPASQRAFISTTPLSMMKGAQSEHRDVDYERTGHQPG